MKRNFQQGAGRLVSRRKVSRRGLALPLVLWSIAFLAGLVVLVSGVVGDWVADEARAERSFRARQLALSGVAMGLSPEVKAGDPLLRSGDTKREGFEVKISDESGKINANYWIAQNKRDIFIRLFEAWGVEDELRDSAIDGLVDWVDGNDFRSLHGAERGEYEAVGRQGFPANRPLMHIREMEAVLGLGDVLAQREDWQPEFTLWHNGKINIHHASEPLLTELAELTPEQCRALFELRAGPDAIEGSDDDVKFESIEEAAGIIGAGGRQLAGLEEYFDVSGSVRRIESTGYCEGTKHRIVVISPENSGGGIVSWEEE
ncbi:MAG: general secretion pathway protein GspK [Terrimicrobiaceae bacterium]